MFIIMKQRKGPHGNKRWMEVADEGFSGPDREPLDALAFTESTHSPVYTFAVFEKLDSPAPDDS